MVAQRTNLIEASLKYQHMVWSRKRIIIILIMLDNSAWILSCILKTFDIYLCYMTGEIVVFGWYLTCERLASDDIRFKVIWVEKKRICVISRYMICISKDKTYKAYYTQRTQVCLFKVDSTLAIDVEIRLIIYIWICNLNKRWFTNVESTSTLKHWINIDISTLTQGWYFNVESMLNQNWINFDLTWPLYQIHQCVIPTVNPDVLIFHKIKLNSCFCFYSSR